MERRVIFHCTAQISRADIMTLGQRLALSLVIKRQRFLMLVSSKYLQDKCETPLHYWPSVLPHESCCCHHVAAVRTCSASARLAAKSAVIFTYQEHPRSGTVSLLQQQNVLRPTARRPVRHLVPDQAKRVHLALGFETQNNLLQGFSLNCWLICVSVSVHLFMQHSFYPWKSASASIKNPADWTGCWQQRCHLMTMHALLDKLET